MVGRRGNMKRLLAGSLALILIGSTSCTSGKTSKTTAAPTTTRETTRQTSEPTTTQTSAPTTTRETEPTETDGEKKMITLSFGPFEEDMPLDEYTSGPYPIFLKGYEYEEIGQVSGDMYEASRECFKAFTDEEWADITHDLTLPDEFNGYTVTWTSSDESVIESDGTVHRPHDRSLYVLLEGAFSNDVGTLKLRYKLRVARDMYEGFTADEMPLLDYYGTPYIWEYNEKLQDTDGGWYIFTTIPDLVFFAANPEEVELYDDCEGLWKDYDLSGEISEPIADTPREAFFCIKSVEQVLHIENEVKQLQFEKMFCEDVMDRYDFDQYFKGVKVKDASLNVIVCNWRRTTIIKCHVLDIPSDFSVKPDITEKEAIEKYDLEYADLTIWENGGEIYLVYCGHQKRKSEIVYVDAHTGEQLAAYSSVIVD